jgi:hypothetical protein
MKRFFLLISLFSALASQAQIYVGSGSWGLSNSNFQIALDSLNGFSNKKIPAMPYGWYAEGGYNIPMKHMRSVFLAPVATYRQTFSSYGQSDSLSLALKQALVGLRIVTGPRAWFDNVATGPLGTRFYLTADAGFSLSHASMKRWDNSSYSQTIFTPYLGVGCGQNLLVVAKQFVLSATFNLQAFHNQTFHTFQDQMFINHTSVHFNNPESWSYSAQLGLKLSWVIE